MFYRKYGVSSDLIMAIVQHDLSRFKGLLSLGSDPNAPDEEGWRPLHAAVGEVDFEGSIEFVKLLLKRGGNVNEWDVHRQETPILTASDPPNLAVAQILLEAGADPNVVRSDGESPLRLCVQAKDLEMVTLLLRYGASNTINKYGGILGLTALALAAMDFNVPMIELLLREGANPETLEEFGETARDKLPPREAHDPQEWDRVMEMLGHRK
jgi:ankyrin repeat protein